jgi:hypothetical protein
MTDTPVTKLDSVERLTVELANELFIEPTELQIDPIRAALTEMWDLSRREAVKEVLHNQSLWSEHGKECVCLTENDADGNSLLPCSFAQTMIELERLAVEEGTR